VARLRRLGVGLHSCIGTDGAGAAAC